MKFNWCAEFVEAASGTTAHPAEQLTPLGHTRAELLAQLANATGMEQTEPVRQYIAEANRRLGKLP